MKNVNLQTGIIICFLNYIKSYEYYSEQFDIHCRKLNCFLIEDDIPGNCRFGEHGENNYSHICKLYYDNLKRFNELLRKFREKHKEEEELNEEKEFKMFVEYLKEYDNELYNEMQD